LNLTKDEKIFLSNLISHFKEEYKEEIGLDIALNTFKSTFKEILPYKSNISSSDYEVLSNRVSLSDWCLLKIFLSQNCLEFILFILALLLFSLLLLQEAQKKEQIQIAEVLYKCIVLHIRKQGMVGFVGVMLIGRSSIRKSSEIDLCFCKREIGRLFWMSWNAFRFKKEKLQKLVPTILFAGPLQVKI
jgi:hypothetical protein